MPTDKKEYNKQYHQSHKEQIASQKALHYQEHKDEIRKKQNEYNLNHKEELAKRNKEFYEVNKQNRQKQMRDYYQSNKEAITKQVRVQSAIYRIRIKTEALTHYGNGKLACVRCGYDDIRALSIDHINGNGNQHRKLINTNIYRYLINHRFPDGYATLCLNCQFLKRVEAKELTKK